MRVGSLVLLGSLIAVSAAAQSHRESVTVEVVDVPAYVTARNGEPVTGLTREDFELYVNGKRQPIEYFDALSSSEPAAALRERRLFLLLFDVAFTHPHSIVRAQRAAAQLVSQASPGDYFAIATYTSRRGVWFAAPFTRDPVALTRAIASLNDSRSGDPLSIVMTTAERRTFESPSTGEVAVASDSGNVASRIAAETLRDVARARTLRAAEDHALDMGDLADRLAQLEGEKHVILLSEGYDGRSPNPSDVRTMSALRDVTSAPWEGFTSLASTDAELNWRILDAHRRFQRANVLLHALDLEGVANTLMANDELNWLVTGTGGKFIANRNDFGRALTDLSSSLSRGYRLGFRPSSDTRDGYNKIEVKLRAPQRGFRVTHRRGFYGTPESANVKDGLYLADVLLNDVPQSGSAATLSLAGTTLTARIPMREVAAQMPMGARAELLLYAFDANGKALLYHREAIPVSSTDDATITLTVPEGTHVAKALLRVDGRLGFSWVGA
jgi:VWFA-related protein